MVESSVLLPYRVYGEHRTNLNVFVPLCLRAFLRSPAVGPCSVTANVARL